MVENPFWFSLPLTKPPAPRRCFACCSWFVARDLLLQMLWELRAEALAGTADLVLVEMKQVAGYMDPLAEIVPPDVSPKSFCCANPPPDADARSWFGLG